MKVKIITLGCKVNQFESQAMFRELTENGWKIAADNEKADVSIVNSCAVTQVSEQKAVKLIHRLRREDPETVIVLTGCMAQAFPESGNKLKEVDIVLGNSPLSINILPINKGSPLLRTIQKRTNMKVCSSTILSTVQEHFSR